MKIIIILISWDRRFQIDWVERENERWMNRGNPTGHAETHPANNGVRQTGNRERK